MRIQLATALLAVPLVALSGSASAAVTLIAGEVNNNPALNFLTANADGSFTEHSHAAPSHDALAPNKFDLVVAKELFASNPAGESATASSAVSAHWNDDGAGGHIDVSGGWILPANISPDENVGSIENGDAPAWSYTFTVDQDSIFRLGLMYTATGDTDGLGLLNLGVTDNGSGPSNTTLINANQDHGLTVKDHFSQKLLAGHTYTIALDSLEIHIGTDSQPAISNFEQGSLDWTITAASGAPEPATWALSIIGFGLAGASLRRRQGAKFA